MVANPLFERPTALTNGQESANLLPSVDTELHDVATSPMDLGASTSSSHNNDDNHVAMGNDSVAAAVFPPNSAGVRFPPSGISPTTYRRVTIDSGNGSASPSSAVFDFPCSPGSSNPMTRSAVEYKRNRAGSIEHLSPTIAHQRSVSDHNGILFSRASIDSSAFLPSKGTNSSDHAMHHMLEQRDRSGQLKGMLRVAQTRLDELRNEIDEYKRTEQKMIHEGSVVTEDEYLSLYKQVHDLREEWELKLACRGSHTQSDPQLIPAGSAYQPTSASGTAGHGSGVVGAPTGSLELSGSAEHKWGCMHCTFLNHPEVPSCEMCERPRDERKFHQVVVQMGGGSGTSSSSTAVRTHRPPSFNCYCCSNPNEQQGGWRALNLRQASANGQHQQH